MNAANASEQPICRVCRAAVAKLTFEHVPARSAFNDQPAEAFSLMEWLNREAGEPIRGRIQQRGSGYKKLCEPCNNSTGSWYVPELGRATRAATRILSQVAPDEEADGDPASKIAQVKFGGVYPLRLATQIITMHLAINPLEFSQAHPELGDFVLDRERVGLSDRYRLYLVLFRGPNARFMGGPNARLNIFTGRVDVVSQIDYPPFGYVLTVDSPDEALPVGDVTQFTTVGYGQRADVEVDLLVGFGHTIYPLDYRSRAQIDQEGELPNPPAQ